MGFGNLCSIVLVPAKINARDIKLTTSRRSQTKLAYHNTYNDVVRVLCFSTVFHDGYRKVVFNPIG